MTSCIDDQFCPLPQAHKDIIAQLRKVEALSIVGKIGGGSPETAVYWVDVKSPDPLLKGRLVLKVDITSRNRKEVEIYDDIKKSPLGPYVPDLRDYILGANGEELSALLLSQATGSFLNSKTTKKLLDSKTKNLHLF